MAKDPTKNTNTPKDTDLKQLAIRFKALRHTFSKHDIFFGVDPKRLKKKLKVSKQLESTYQNYIENTEKYPFKPAIFPWDSRFRSILYLLSTKITLASKITFTIIGLILLVNFCPGPTQHIAEFILARALYDTTNISRLPTSLQTYGHSASIVDSNGAIIKSYGRRDVTSTISVNVKNALLACEDHYLLPHPQNPWYVNAFLIHAGVSWFNLVGAVKDTILGNTRGASTIIMQNAKKTLGNKERTIAHKLEEIIISYLLVAKFGKDMNLDFYINTVPVGNNIYGFQAAAKYYFKRNLNELNYQQLVTIGSFIPNHNRMLAFYKVWRGKNIADLSSTQHHHLTSGMNKVNLALAHLMKLKEISPDDYEKYRLKDEESIRKIGFRESYSPLYGEEEWTSWNVIKEVCSRSYSINRRQVSGPELLLDEQGDVIIETAINLKLVEQIKTIAADFFNDDSFKEILKQNNIKTWKKDLNLYKKRRITPPYVNFDGFMNYLYRHLNVGVIITNQQGRIIAYLGGKEFFQHNGTAAEGRSHSAQEQNNSKQIIIDLMNKQAKIAPASTIKPFIAYYAMVTAGASLQTLYPDEPVEFKYLAPEEKKIWLPRNWYPYDAKGSGNNRYWGRKYSLLESQVISINTIFARLYSKSTIQSSMLSGFDKIKLDYNKQDAKTWPFGIGSSDVPVRQWLGAYSAFLDGYYREPTFVSRITINGREIYNGATDPSLQPIFFLDAEKERQEELQALYEVCNRGSGASMKSEFKYHNNLVSGKTGTAPNSRTSLFISHFNPYQDRNSHSQQNMTMIVLLTTNTGGYKNVGASTQGPTKIAGRIYNQLFNEKLNKIVSNKLADAKKTNAHFRNNHVFWANVNRYMEQLLHDKCGDQYIYQNIVGVDGFEEALEQLLNPANEIYTGKDDLFNELVSYYCDQKKVVRMNSAQ